MHKKFLVALLASMSVSVQAMDPTQEYEPSQEGWQQAAQSASVDDEEALRRLQSAAISAGPQRAQSGNSKCRLSCDESLSGSDSEGEEGRMDSRGYVRVKPLDPRTIVMPQICDEEWVGELPDLGDDEPARPYELLRRESAGPIRPHRVDPWTGEEPDLGDRHEAEMQALLGGMGSGQVIGQILPGLSGK